MVKKDDILNLENKNKIYNEAENTVIVEDHDDFEEKIVPSEKLGRGWYWHKYNDGSGYLESPDGKEYMSYDLDTNEYKETNDSQYEFFPLSYYYADGINPSEFKPFEYMENEMIEVILPKEKKDEEFCL